jgi:hypothetical protein
VLTWHTPACAACFCALEWGVTMMTPAFFATRAHGRQFGNQRRFDTRHARKRSEWCHPWATHPSNPPTALQFGSCSLPHTLTALPSPAFRKIRGVRAVQLDNLLSLPYSNLTSNTSCASTAFFLGTSGIELFCTEGRRSQWK